MHLSFPQTASPALQFSFPQGCHTTSPKYAVRTSIATFPASDECKTSLGSLYRNPICRCAATNPSSLGPTSLAKGTLFSPFCQMYLPSASLSDYWYSSHAR